MKVLSIDPGYERLGIAVLEKEGGKETLLYSDCFKTNPKNDFTDRVFEIGREIEKVIDIYNPEDLSIENLFFNTNQKTALNVSEARGVIIYQAMLKGLKIYQYTPLQIKAAVTGNGRADKKSVIFMTEKLLKIDKKIKYDDEYDAIACGLTHLAHQKTNF